jgi:hypothetical protein
MNRKPQGRFQRFVSPYADEDFVWDPAKSDLALSERDIMFHAARMAFRGRLLRRRDTRKNYGEVRYQVLGEVAGKGIVHIAYTPRGGKCRIISVRPATAEERDAYFT